MSFSFVPPAGVCETTRFAAKPWMEPVTFQAKPPSSSAPLAKTNAWPVTSGTTTVGALTGACFLAAGAESRCAAPYVSVAPANRKTAASKARRGR